MANLDSWAPRAQSVLRIIVGFLLMPHGAQKLFGFLASSPMMGPHPLASLMGFAGVLELFGGLLFLIGLFTRPVSFILCGFAAVAYFMAHAPRGLFPTLNGGQLAILFCFVFLYLSVAGGGAWSVDTQIARRQSIA